MAALLLLSIWMVSVPAAQGRGLAVSGADGGAALTQVMDLRRGEDRLERTESLIGERNHAAMAQLKRFYATGWQVQEQVPWLDTEATGMDPIWTELRLSTTDIPERELYRVAQLFRSSQDRRLRAMIIDAVGRSLELKAQELLVEFYQRTEDEVERRQILCRIRPRSAGDPLAEFLMSEARNRQRPLAIRKLAATTLVLELGGESGRGLASAGADSVFPRLFKTIWGTEP